MSLLTLKDRYRGALLGLACGDAVGTTVEFRPRDSFAPLTGMVGGGPFALAAGRWTDDTSMALCLAESLVGKAGFDATDQMARYANWYEWGYWSSTGVCFDIGMTTRQALQHFLLTREPYAGSADPASAGNGSLMRLAPIPLFFFPDAGETARHARLSSRTTHAAAEAEDACVLFAEAIRRALQGLDKDALLALDDVALDCSDGLRAVARGSYRAKERAAIRGSGYAVESLEAALWCFARGESFREIVLLAANLGDDADTTAAIAGQLAGAFHGESGIPADWLATLHQAHEITALAESLLARRSTVSP